MSYQIVKEFPLTGVLVEKNIQGCDEYTFANSTCIQGDDKLQLSKSIPMVTDIYIIYISDSLKFVVIFTKSG